MRIEEWECTASEDGAARGVSHATRGTFTWLNGRLIGHGDAPPAVMSWILRPMLSESWEQGLAAGLTGNVHSPNPYDGEPPNKDRDPS